jgi:putative transposase
VASWLLIVQPEALLRWHRELFRRVWKRKSGAGKVPGRPSLSGSIVSLIVQMAQENRAWGAERIRGELVKLGIGVSKSTIQKYMRHVRQPASPQQAWLTFLHNHMSEIWACDFLQTYDL